MGLVAQFLQMLIFNPVGWKGRMHLYCNEHIMILAIVSVTCIPNFIPVSFLDQPDF